MVMREAGSELTAACRVRLRPRQGRQHNPEFETGRGLLLHVIPHFFIKQKLNCLKKFLPISYLHVLKVLVQLGVTSLVREIFVMSTSAE